MWMNPRIAQRRPGNEDVKVVLVDVSGSIQRHDQERIKQACEEARPHFTGLRLFAWALECVEVPWQKSLLGKGVYPDLYEAPLRDGRTACVLAGGGNDLPKTLRLIAELEPSRTILLSDGFEETSRKCLDCLEIADQMSGEIDAFCTTAQCSHLWGNPMGPGFMAELARRSGGRFMDTTRIDLRHEVIESIRFVRQRVFRHRRIPDRHVYHGRG